MVLRPRSPGCAACRRTARFGQRWVLPAQCRTQLPGTPGKRRARSGDDDAGGPPAGIHYVLSHADCGFRPLPRAREGRSRRGRRGLPPGSGVAHRRGIRSPGQGDYLGVRRASRHHSGRRTHPPLLQPHRDARRVFTRNVTVAVSTRPRCRKACRAGSGYRRPASPAW